MASFAIAPVLGARGSYPRAAEPELEAAAARLHTAARRKSPALRCFDALSHRRVRPAFSAARSFGCDAASLRKPARNAPAASKQWQETVCQADGAASASSGEQPSVPEYDAETKKKYKIWRIRVFASLFLGYACSYIARSGFTYVAPLLRDQAGMTLQQIGVINSVFPVAYGVSKFVSGVISDYANPRYFIALGLIVTGLLDVLFCASTNVTWMAVIWGLNGWIAAVAAPAAAKTLTAWYAPSERGTWWGIWNTSTNLGGFLSAFISAWFAQKLGWKWGMYVPGIVGIVMGILFFFMARGDPTEVGLPPIDEFKGEKKVVKKDAAGAKSSTEGMTQNQIFMKYVMLNPAVWILAISYLGVYFIRTGVTNWSHFYLMDVKGVKDAAEAASRVSGRELGGLLSNFVSGPLSDKVFGGRRIPVIAIFLLGVVGSTAGFWLSPIGAPAFLDWLWVFLLGFFVYGPQMLVGLAGVELAHKSAASSAIGFLGLVSYLGAGIAGAPLTILVKQYGWNAFFMSLIACALFSLALVLPLWNRRARETEE
eukprot:tig00020703_g13120.t1